LLTSKVAIFVDGSNMFYAQKAVGYYIDFNRVKEFFSQEKDLFKAFFYVGTTSPPAVKEKKFLDFLIYRCGYTVRNKEIKTILDDETGESKLKCNLDIEIAVEMFKEIEHYDTAILMSGDGDFESVIELLRSRGKTTEVVSARNMLARELANVAHKVHFLEELRPSIERQDRSYGTPSREERRMEKQSE